MLNWGATNGLAAYGRQHYDKDVEFSSYSCYFTDDEDLAKKFLEVVQDYSGKGHIYKAVKVH